MNKTSIFSINSNKYSSDFIAPNVPAVYDGLSARIRACEARPGLANCAGVRRGNGAQRNDLAEWKPSPPSAGAAYTVLLGEVWSFL
jgi:hypothetical protein